MSTFRLAVAQPKITKDPQENGQAVRRMMREAADEGARLIHFPEGMMSGYAVEQIDDWSDVDWATVRTELEATAALASDLSMWVVVGSAHLLSPPNRPHNSMYVITDEGRLLDRYDKRICSHTEITRFYTPGFEPVTFEVDGVTFGCAICVEVNFPDLFAEYERLGVDCLLLSAYPVDSIFETKARAYAAIYNYWVSVSIPAQCTDLFQSVLFEPDGTPLATVETTEGLVVGQLDTKEPSLDIALNRARPWRGLIRGGGPYEDYRIEDPRSQDRYGF